MLFVFHVCHAILSDTCSIVVTCWERADLLDLLYMMCSCVLSLSHKVSWVRCGIECINLCLLSYFHNVNYRA